MIKKIFYFTGVLAVITSVVIISSCPEASSKSSVSTHWTKYSGDPVYWSKCESVANITNTPDLPNPVVTIGTDSNVSASSSGKFGNRIYSSSSVPANPGPFANWYPLGNAFTITDKGTLSFWMKATDIAAFSLYMGGFIFYWDNGVNGIQLTINSKSKTYNYNITDGLWHHIYVIWDKNYDGIGNASIKLYVDNVLVIQNIGESSVNWNTYNKFYYEWWDGTMHYGNDVSIDNVKLWDSIVTEDTGIIKQIGDSEDYINIVTTGSN